MTKEYKSDQMMTLLLVGQENSLSDLSRILEKYDNVSISRVDSGELALDIIHHQTLSFVIADEQLADKTGLQFLEELVMVNPMINSALISSLSARDFHEASEGLGIIAQLPIPTEEKKVADLMVRLHKILDMTA